MSGCPSSTAEPSVASRATTVPAMPARPEFVSFLTSMIPITLPRSIRGVSGTGSLIEIAEQGRLHVRLARRGPARLCGQRGRGGRGSFLWRCLRLDLAQGPRRAATADPQLEVPHLKLELREAGFVEQASDFRNVLCGEDHRLPPKMDITCLRGSASGFATGAASLADQTVSGRLWSRNIRPSWPTAHSMSCGRP